MSTYVLAKSRPTTGTAILKASLGILQPWEHRDVSRPGEHGDVRIGVDAYGPVAMKCAQLNTLWFRAPPPVTELAVLKGKKRPREGDEAGKGDEGDNYGRGGRQRDAEEAKGRTSSTVEASDRKLCVGGNYWSEGHLRTISYLK